MKLAEMCTNISPGKINGWEIKTWTYLTSLATTEMKIKTTVIYHYTCIRMAKMKTSDKVGQDAEKVEPSYIASRNVKW